MTSKGRLVYSSGPDNTRDASSSACKRCAADPCRCEPSHSVAPEQHDVRVRRDRSGRRGKTVTVVGPLQLTRADAAKLLKELKRLCGGGGTLKLTEGPGATAAFDVEVQGDHADRLVAELGARGYRVKRSGG